MTRIPAHGPCMTPVQGSLHGIYERCRDSCACYVSCTGSLRELYEPCRYPCAAILTVSRYLCRGLCTGVLTQVIYSVQGSLHTCTVTLFRLYELSLYTPLCKSCAGVQGSYP